MKPLSLEWIERAEDDWDAAQRLQRARTRPNYGLVCFHAQQCAEKYLKARLEEAGLPIQKTHNLILLLTQVQSVEPSWSGLQPELTGLNAYSVATRYPGQTASKLNAQHALKDCKAVRKTIRQSFGLPV
ncbi:MAG: HEPN domain-containing protein [Acidobacteria bacterium]|nr:HEPN domain-containing protein [Acidobacteriota bacterium]MBI3421453.1 HEPN domain-containing protein [Acidobacteriota bacterium]